MLFENLHPLTFTLKLFVIKMDVAAPREEETEESMNLEEMIWALVAPVSWMGPLAV